jgi:hypothetical protein
MHKKKSLIYILALIAATEASGRSIYLNGTDISSVRNQNLKDVTLTIDEKGDIFITASHYQVSEQTHYAPLSRLETKPEHKSPQALRTPSSSQSADNLPPHPLSNQKTQPSLNSVEQPAISDKALQQRQGISRDGKDAKP